MSFHDKIPGISADEYATLKDFLETPRGFVLGIVFSALIGGILDISRAIIDAIRFVFWGSPSTYGIADIPRLLIQPVIDGYALSGELLLAQIEAIQRTMLQIVPDLWLLGPVVAYGFVILELVVLGWIAWRIIRSIDVPIVNLGPLLKTLAAPIRTLLRVIR